MRKKAWIVVPAGFAYEPADNPDDLFEVIGYTEIYMGESITVQMLNIPEDVDALGIAMPQEMNERDQRVFSDVINVAWCGMQTSRLTIKSLMPAWIESSHANFYRLTACLPVDRILKKEGTTRAVLCANGPSLKGTLAELKKADLQDVAIFSCWHAAHKVQEAGLKVDYLCHTDNAVPDFDFNPGTYPLDTVFVATPKAAPAFVALSKHYTTYTYIPLDIPIIAGIYAKALKCQEHDNIVSTVASMVLNTALYAGYDELILAGFDNGWVDEADAYPECTKAVGVENQHGITVQTYAPFALGAFGLETRIKRQGGLKVYQTTKNAIDIGAVEYKPIKDFVYVG